jgi:hypothetical protein
MLLLEVLSSLSLVDMLTAKIDLLLKKLEYPGLDHVKMVDVE